MRFMVAGHGFTVDAPEGFIRSGYEPFLTEENGDVFRLTVEEGRLREAGFELELTQQNEGNTIEVGHDGRKPVFRFGFQGQMTGEMECDADYQEARLTLNTTDSGRRTATLDNALMVMYALATAGKGTLLMHASVVVKDARGYLFVAPSGTGKSTHSSLWLRCIPGTRLLNDDNPVVRIGADGTATVYGSPWSGKTPCYINEHYPVGAVVEIAQAPRNSIAPVRPVCGYSIMSAATSGKRWEKKLADGLHDTLNRAAAAVRVYHLDCLPDEEAARICYNTIKTPDGR